MFHLNLQVYCSSHVPKSGPGHLDQTSVGIRQALNAPKSNKPVNEQIRGGSRDIERKFLNVFSFKICKTKSPIYKCWQLKYGKTFSNWVISHFTFRRLFHEKHENLSQKWNFHFKMKVHWSLKLPTHMKLSHCWKEQYWNGIKYEGKRCNEIKQREKIMTSYELADKMKANECSIVESIISGFDLALNLSCRKSNQIQMKPVFICAGCNWEEANIFSKTENHILFVALRLLAFKICERR